MNVIRYPQKEEWDELLKRPVMNVDTLRETVCRVLDDVKTGGRPRRHGLRKAVRPCGTGVSGRHGRRNGRGRTSGVARTERCFAPGARNIGKFHASQRFETTKVEVRPGVTCWQKAVPIERVGLYIPGGRHRFSPRF